VPESPELEALRIRLEPTLQGEVLNRVDVFPARAHLLRSPPAAFKDLVVGRRLTQISRRGKHLILNLAEGPEGTGNSILQLIVNPMLGGRFQLARAGARPSATVFELGFGTERVLRLLDPRGMSRTYLTARPDLDVPGWSELGPEADQVGTEVGLEAFRRSLRRRRDELKDLLRNQTFLAGIGNAYSDEILFSAALLPLRRRVSLTPADEIALYQAIPRILKGALASILAQPPGDLSRQDRSFLTVHGRVGGACPRCRHRLSQLGTKREPLTFCRGCQV